MNAPDTSIEVKQSFDILHCWPNAPEHRAYLSHPHRHHMKVSVEVYVYHSDRDIEFHDLQDDIRKTVMQGREGLLNLGSLSMEQVAEKLWQDLNEEYSLVSIRVSEDNSCAAILRRQP